MITCLLNGEKINIWDYTDEELREYSSKNMLICPICGEPYEFCHGMINESYFRHKYKDQCNGGYYEPETDEHIIGKKDLYNWLLSQKKVKNVELEKWIADTKQISDIYFEYLGNRYVIEYQCTPISTEYFERHELYQSTGINDIWICGAQKYFQKYHTGSGKKRVGIIENESKLYYDPNTKMMYYFCNDFIFNKEMWKYVNMDEKPYKYRCSKTAISYIKYKICCVEERNVLLHFDGINEYGEIEDGYKKDICEIQYKPGKRGFAYCRYINHMSIYRLLNKDFNQDKIQEDEYEQIWIRYKEH